MYQTVFGVIIVSDLLKVNTFSQIRLINDIFPVKQTAK